MSFEKCMAYLNLAIAYKGSSLTNTEKNLEEARRRIPDSLSNEQRFQLIDSLLNLADHFAPIAKGMRGRDCFKTIAKQIEPLLTKLENPTLLDLHAMISRHTILATLYKHPERGYVTSQRALIKRCGEWLRRYSQMVETTFVTTLNETMHAHEARTTRAEEAFEQETKEVEEDNIFRKRRLAEFMEEVFKGNYHGQPTASMEPASPPLPPVVSQGVFSQPPEERQRNRKRRRDDNQRDDANAAAKHTAQKPLARSATR